MSAASSDTNGDSPFECLDSRDSNGSHDSPRSAESTKVVALEAVSENNQLLSLQQAMSELGGDGKVDPLRKDVVIPQNQEVSHAPNQEVPEKLFLLSLTNETESKTELQKTGNKAEVKMEEILNPNEEQKKDTVPSRSPSPKEEQGFIRGFLNRVAEKAKNSMDTMITTLDPGMKAYLYSGGDVNILITSEKESKIGPIREAFIDIFGRATVKGICARSASIACQPVGPGCAQYAASERISSTRIMHQHDVPQNQTMVSVEGFLVEMTPESWFEMSCLVLEDPLTGLRISTYTQATPVPCEAINHLTFETPNDYPLRQTGFSMTIGQIMSQKLGVSHEEWHEKLTGIPRRSTIYLAACCLARIFKDKISRSSTN